MGTHPNAPSLVAGSEQTLGGWLAAHPEALGDATVQRFGIDLPFLFKVRGVLEAQPRGRVSELTSVTDLRFAASDKPGCSGRPRCGCESAPARTCEQLVPGILPRCQVSAPCGSLLTGQRCQGGRQCLTTPPNELKHCRRCCRWTPRCRYSRTRTRSWPAACMRSAPRCTLC